MHKSLFTTDEIYGMLTENDTRERLSNLTKDRSADDELSALKEQVRRIAEKLGI